MPKVKISGTVAKIEKDWVINLIKTLRQTLLEIETLGFFPWNILVITDLKAVPKMAEEKIMVVIEDFVARPERNQTIRRKLIDRIATDLEAFFRKEEDRQSEVAPIFLKVQIKDFKEEGIYLLETGV